MRTGRPNLHPKSSPLDFERVNNLEDELAAQAFAFSGQSLKVLFSQFSKPAYMSAYFCFD